MVYATEETDASFASNVASVTVSCPLFLSLSHGVCNRRSRCAFCIECGGCTRMSFSVMCSLPHALSLCRLPYPLSALLLSSCSRPLCRCYPRPLPHCSGARIRDASVPACALYVPPLSHPSVCACECDCLCVCVFFSCAHMCMCVCVCARVLYVVACVLMCVCADVRVC